MSAGDRAVYDAVARMRDALLAIGIKEPAAILLKDRDDGMRLLSMLRDERHWVFEPGGHETTTHPDGSVWCEVKIMGVALRWPALLYARQCGAPVWS